MPNPLWPTSLPQRPLVDNYQREARDTSIRTKMDVGPDHVRRRYTAIVYEINVQLLLTATQLATLRAFVDVDLKGGSLRFDWVEAETGAAATFRIIGQPIYTSISGTLYNATMSLEQV